MARESGIPFKGFNLFKAIQG
ncbi:hypothetical protein CCACVL1_14159 [Corchorus capsularis]|uniref:Uncharacterized protein n=1 Tax=Corchorus capsularis TaxID=210143 RepID=A0A1R3I803_COCAP|nr:hypothetical protein CCACVL1_14159 [Corchorus capsularis]